VAHRETKPGAFARWLGRKERIEHLLFYLGRDARAVVVNANFHTERTKSPRALRPICGAAWRNGSRMVVSICSRSALT
jgi:hypothetical protein